MAKTTNIQLIISAKDDATKTLRGVSKEVGNISSSTKALGKASSIALGAVKAVGLAMSLAGGFALKSSSDFEQNRIAFESMLGSADRARKLLKEVGDFAAKTPFELPQVVEGSKRLLAYNISAEKIIPTFKMLGDIASGVGTEKLPQLITAFGQVQAKGKLAGGELMQFTEAGVGLGQELQKNFKVSREELEKMISSGKVTSEQVTIALQNMTKEGGLFFDGMENQSGTFSGIMSNISDDIGKVAREIMGISSEGDIRKGSIFYYLKLGAQSFKDWLGANKDTMINDILSFGSSFKNAFTEAKNYVKSLGSETSIVGNFFRDMLGPTFTDLKDTIVKAWKDIKASIEPIMPVLKLFVQFILIAMVGAIVTYIAFWAKFFSGIISAFASLVKAISSFIRTIGYVFEGLFSWILGDNKSAVDSFKKAWESLKTFFKALFSSFGGLVSAFTVPAMDAIAKVKSAFSGISNKISGGSNSSGKALGGAVTGGTPYMVGEHRPEVFVPSQSGNIRQMDQMGGRTVSVNFNNVSVRSDYDLDTIIRAVKDTLARDQKMASFGIRTM